EVETSYEVCICAESNATVSNPAFDSVTGTGSFDVTFLDGPNTTTVSVQLKDSDNDVSNVSSIDVTVSNVAPTVTLSGPATANERSKERRAWTTSEPGGDTFSVV